MQSWTHAGDPQGMKNTDDVRVVISRLHGIAVRAPFALYGDSDNHNPTDVIAQIVASGLAMPDRDYAQGRLNNWWTAEDLKSFQEKGACVVNQFDNYFVEPGLHHNGKLVPGESIGDLAGAKIACRAFQISRRGKPPLPTVDSFTPEQQFFIA